MEIHVTFSSMREMEDFCRQMVPAGEATQTVKREVPVAESPAPAKAAAPIPVSAPAQTMAPVSEAAPVLAATPVPAMGAYQTPQVVPTANATYTLDELARAAMTLMDSGRQIDLQQLLAQFGVEALPALPKEKYGAFATALRGLGAQI